MQDELKRRIILLSQIQPIIIRVSEFFFSTKNIFHRNIIFHTMNAYFIHLEQIKKLKPSSVLNYKYVLTKAYSLICKDKNFNPRWLYLYENELFNMFSIMKKNTLKNWLIAIIGFITCCIPPTNQEEKSILENYKDYLANINMNLRKQRHINETCLEEIQHKLFTKWTNETVHYLSNKNISNNNILYVEKVILANIYVFELPHKMSDINCLELIILSNEEILDKSYAHLKNNSLVIDKHLNSHDFVFTGENSAYFIPVDESLKSIFHLWIPFCFMKQDQFPIKYVFFNPRKLRYYDQKTFTNEYIKVNQINESLRTIIGYGIRHIRSIITYNILYGKNTKTI